MSNMISRIIRKIQVAWYKRKVRARLERANVEARRFGERISQVGNVAVITEVTHLPEIFMVNCPNCPEPSLSLVEDSLHYAPSAVLTTSGLT